MNHNKKRNTALMYEFLVLKIAKQLLEENSNSVPLDILKKYFKPGTELHKELRLVQALLRTTIGSEILASNIIQEAKNAARTHDVKKLDREKSFLLKEINYRVNDQYFFDQPIVDYKMYATIQMLVNEWRQGNSSDMLQLIKHESILHNWLLTNKPEKAPSSLIEGSLGMNRLLIKVMTKKLNEKYSNTLLSEQKDLLRTYVFSCVKNNKAAIIEIVKEVQKKTLDSIESYKLEEKNSYVLEKLDRVKQQVMSESADKIDDEAVSRHMTYLKLIAEVAKDNGAQI